jgi:hypothetical protein
MPPAVAAATLPFYKSRVIRERMAYTPCCVSYLVNSPLGPHRLTFVVRDSNDVTPNREHRLAPAPVAPVDL